MALAYCIGILFEIFNSPLSALKYWNSQKNCAHFAHIVLSKFYTTKVFSKFFSAKSRSQTTTVIIQGSFFMPIWRYIGSRCQNVFNHFDCILCLLAECLGNFPKTEINMVFLKKIKTTIFGSYLSKYRDQGGDF